MNGQEAKKTFVMQTFTDLVTLVYHEGRNVRHLVKDGRIDEPKRYSRLINLPCNRGGPGASYRSYVMQLGLEQT